MKVIITKAQASDNEFSYQVKKEGLKSYVEELFGWDEDEQRKKTTFEDLMITLSS